MKSGLQDVCWESTAVKGRRLSCAGLTNPTILGALWRDIAWKSRPRLRLNVFILLPGRSGHEVWASVRKGVTLGKVAAYG